jgi:hypothetical protein
MAGRYFSRREFVRKNSMAGLGAAVALGVTPSILSDCIAQSDIPAILGGTKIRAEQWPVWPQWKPELYEKQVLKVLRSGVWSRAGVVTEFEEKWAETIGTKRCLAVVNGTNALIASLIQFNVGGGDEVIVTPYTWIPPEVVQHFAAAVSCAALQTSSFVHPVNVADARPSTVIVKSTSPIPTGRINLINLVFISAFFINVLI